ncbi:MAG: tetratricopeptide repeat protein [Chloroflexi bacterium]|nr:tetratricopeptide repeat protein [Chloroflexota bacterium]MCY3583898.1 tetratricopeptide repeat protein [Chloroflexota bacterium]MCY3715814.1 tetratricopeptide repeat protein [Chloroflexota bacterium]MDE2651899.1 tetratricopeptide repeat protein [Chloroflexota bacterium]MXV94157.1 tetratricopeptide repeat protein [Chloroflexota bacterium]
MQIRTPKRYRGVQRRSIISCRRLLLYLLLLLLIAAGAGIYLNRQVAAPIIEEAVEQLIGEIENRVATLSAPTPTPTPDPGNSLVEANNYWQQGALRRATDLYLEIAPATPNTVEVFRRIAIGLINASRYEEASQQAARAIHADPFDAEAWAIQAWALDWQGKPAEALAYALHALELDPQNSRASAYLGEIYHSLEQSQRAENLLDELLTQDPQSAEAYRARGLVRWDSDYSAALADFQAAYELAGNMNLIAVDIATIEKDLRNYEAALEMLQQILETDPYNPRALFRLSEIQISYDGNFTQAKLTLQNCLDFNPDYFHCHYMLGRANDRLGDTSAAAVNFATAIDLGSQEPRHHYWAGWSQIQLGNCSRAMDYLEPGLQLARDINNQQLIADISAVIPNCDPGFTPGS